MSAAKPQTPSCHADRKAEHLPVGGGLQPVVAEAPKRLPQPLHPDLGMASKPTPPPPGTAPRH